jgi:hypothetical protein
MRKVGFLSFFLTLLLLFSGINWISISSTSEVPSAGSTLYVGPTSTYNNIQDAIDNASSGDTIIVENGTYNEYLTISTNGITLIGNSSTNCNLSAGNNIGILVIADWVNISGLNISTSGGPFYHAIFLNNSDNCNIIDTRLSTSGQNSHGIMLNSSLAIISNSTILTDVQSLDINITNFGKLNTLNCSFNDSKINVEYDNGGILQVKNYLNILVFYDDGTTPISGADVNITDNNVVIYSTPGYNGNDPTTDSSGRIGPILITDKWYFYNNIAIENITNVSVKKTADRSWENFTSNIDMSLSHTETFISSDITKPPKPDGIIITRIGVENSLNITWNLNIDTVIYEVWTIKSSFWVFLGNVTHPQTWILDNDLEDNMDHYYKLQAWDSVDLASGFTGVKNFTLIDITPPTTPKNLTVKPVPNDDVLNISWDLNSDDIDNYELWWREPVKQKWKLIDNITHPRDYYIWSDDLLINGSSYEFRLRAWDKVSLFSFFTNPASGVHRDYVAPEPPPTLFARTISDTFINLSWTASPSQDVDGYLVYISPPGSNSGGPYIYSGKTKMLSYNYTDLKENLNYYFVVKSFDEANNTSPYSIETSNTTSAIPPSIPTFDELPEYTNHRNINITGTSESGTRVIVFANGIEKGSGKTDSSGSFEIEISLIEGRNEIKIRARDSAYVFSKFSDSQNTTLDLEAPIPNAGSDISTEEGQFALFNASASSDNYGISDYEWEFNYDGEIKTFHGKLVTFKFDVPGEYLVTLTVTDLAGNIAIDTFLLNVTTPPPERPTIIKTVPEDNATDVPVNTGITITFNLPMDTDSVLASLNIEPKFGYSGIRVNWTNNDRVFKIFFEPDLLYDTVYLITISEGNATNGASLLNTPFIIIFTTSTNGIIPEITVVEPIEGFNIQTGAVITVSGTTHGIEKDTMVMVSLDGKSVNGQTKGNGNWSVDIRAPNSEGDYQITIKIGELEDFISITVESPDSVDQKDDDKDRKGLFGMGQMMDLIFFAIIVIIFLLIIIILKIKRRKTGEESEFFKDEDEGEDEEE